MALTKDKKHEVVEEVSNLLNSSNMTVVATYQKTGVKQMQELRRQASQNGTTIKVVKNRLVVKALKSSDKFKDVDTSFLSGMLMYAFNQEDEVAPAQVLAKFAKSQPSIELIGGINNEGTLISQEDVRALASLPSKDQLRGQLVGTIAAPLSGFVSVVSGNMRGVLNVLNARSQQLN